LVGGVAAALGLTLAGCTTVNPHYDPTRAHHRPDGFQNIDPAAHMPRPFAEFLRWQRERARLTIAPPVVDLSVVAPPLAAIHANRDALAVTWIGHATALVQIAGVNVLTDPVFSERASPVQWAGPRRWQPPGLRADQLPHIDVVLVSHNHYDHLDAASIAALAAQPGGPPLFVVPLGLERWFGAAGVQSVRWLDWWQSLQVDGLTITLTPAQHWSRRSYGDTMTTLWGGFVVESAPRHGRPGLRVFFAGDTGYSVQHFRAIGARFAPIDLALIPIGAYEPRWFMAARSGRSAPRHGGWRRGIPHAAARSEVGRALAVPPQRCLLCRTLRLLLPSARNRHANLCRLAVPPRACRRRLGRRHVRHALCGAAERGGTAGPAPAPAPDGRGAAALLQLGDRRGRGHAADRPGHVHRHRRGRRRHAARTERLR